MRGDLGETQGVRAKEQGSTLTLDLHFQKGEELKAETVMGPTLPPHRTV